MGVDVKVFIFVGPHQSKQLHKIVAAIQPFGKRAEYVALQKGGKNALDFHIAYYIGKLSRQHPAAQFHIVSKDSGYDPLILNLKPDRVSVKRYDSVAEIPLPRQKAHSKTNDDGKLLERVINDLKKRESSRPKTLTRLKSTIASCLQKKSSDPEIEDIIVKLREQSILAVEGAKVSYSFTESISG